jgi:prophage regulatory protein
MVSRRILRKPATAEKVGYSAAHICRLEREGRFPRKVRLGPGERGACGWFEDEIETWLTERASARGGEAR